MDETLNREAIVSPSGNIVAREIDGELIIVPVVAGIGDLEDELFTLNPTGRDVWRRIDGKTRLKDIAAALAETYSGDPEDIERDVLGLVRELVRRRMLVITDEA